MKIKKVRATYYEKYDRGEIFYFKKVNQHRDTMGWYHPKRNEIGIVDQYNWLKNAYIFTHEFIHYLNAKVHYFIDRVLDETSGKMMWFIWTILRNKNE